MVLPPSFSRQMGEIETVEAEKMRWIYLPRGTFYPTLPICRGIKEVRSKHIHSFKVIFIQGLLFAVLMSTHQLSRACRQEALKRTAPY